MKKTYIKPAVAVNGDLVELTRASFDSLLKPHWPYPEGENYAFVEES